MLPSTLGLPVGDRRRLPSPLQNAKRALQSPTRKQRFLVSLLSAALGLLCAWAVFGRGSSGGSGTAPAGGSGTAAAQLLAGTSRSAQSVGAGSGAGEQPRSLATPPQQKFATLQQAAAAVIASSTAAGGSGGGSGGSGGSGGGVTKAAAALAHLQQQKQLQKQQRTPPPPPAVVPGMEDERQWFAKLSSAACRHAEELRVCSHRGRLEMEGVPPGSLSAYSVLFKAGVECFDVDFVQTADSQVLAAHPDDLRAALGAAAGVSSTDSGKALERSLAELRGAGADEERFPAADALIKVFAVTLEESGQLWKQGGRAAGQQAPDYERLPLLLMDLKGAAYSEAVINNMTAAAQAAGAAAHVALFVADAEQLAMVQRRTHWTGPLIRAFMDAEDPNPAVLAAELEPYSLLGPSIKMGDAFFAATGQLGTPVMAWTVDTPQALHRALEANLNRVISNRPLALRGVLMDWRDRCSERRQRRRVQQQQQQGWEQ